MSSKPRRVLLACDKFKGSLTAVDVAAALARGIAAAAPAARTVRVPVADGGDGTLDAAVAAGFAPIPVVASGPTGEPVQTRYAVRDDLAVVEMADACGLLRLPGGPLHPMTASSRGLGEVIAAALDAGFGRLVVGIGGSASTDGGAGMLAALGARMLDGHGSDLPDGGGALGDLATLDLSALHPAVAGADIVLASDVTNPLLGTMGAPTVFAPQKGASPEQVDQLEAALTRFAAVVTAATGRDDSARPGAGAAGGVGYAAQAVLGARMRPGIDVVLEMSRFAELVADAELVVTGEGSLDRQTLLGKTPAGVARAATAAGVPVVAVCGRSLLAAPEVHDTGIAAVYALTDLEPDPEVCMRQAGPLLERLGARLAAE
ncbi:MAG TPA: glycerate kinase, partial [Candidatus Lustribacter sp.]|nr:glycerate kinase [Candidatus Lustribacter sp.]